MKKTLFLLSIVAFSLNANAQQYKRGFRLGFGINGGLPTDSEKYEGALGADIRLQHDFTAKTSMTLTTGYNHLFVKGDDQGFVPLKLGAKFFLNKNLYAQGEAGVGFGVSNDLGNTLILSPSFGFANKYIDVSLRYENYNNYHTDQIGLRIAYGFSLK